MSFIWERRGNRIYLGLAAFFCCGLWILFKLFYPNPNIIFDSYSYIRAADLNLSVNAWPIGYSRFLYLFGKISHSSYFLLTTQYVLLEVACLFFFFTWILLLKPGKVVKNIVFFLLFCNPLLLYISNYVLSDTLFITLSLIWFTHLIWIIHSPRIYMIFTHAILLVLVFSVRYNALYYPIISFVAILCSRASVAIKICFVGLSVSLLLIFVQYTVLENRRCFGVPQFSAFGGWKLANDALYMYIHEYGSLRNPMPDRFKVIDDSVRSYFRQINNLDSISKDDPSSGSHFMFDLGSPLIVYMGSLYGAGWPFFGTKKWFAVAPLYQQYGFYLIRSYPVAFARYFVLPNIVNYLVPQPEILGSPVPFTLHESFGGSYLRHFIGVTTVDAKPAYIKMSSKILYLFPILFTVIHLLFVAGLVVFWTSIGRKEAGSVKRILLLVGLIWGIDFVFSVVSAVVVIRYQVFMIILEASFGLWFIEKHLRNKPLNPIV